MLVCCIVKTALTSET